MSDGPFAGAVAAVLDGLDEGDVMTYGEIAAEAGYPGGARAVGNYLRTTSGHPWWRVVNAAGRLAPGHEREQARLLRNEGVQIEHGRVMRS